MKFLIVVVALVAAAMGQSAFKIKGHSIGEGGEDFLKLEAATQDALSDCHANPPHRLSVDDVKRIDKQKHTDGFGMQLDIQAAKQGRVYDRNVDDYNRKCGTLMNVFDNGGQGDVMSTYANPGTVTTSSATWKFDGGKLVGLQMIVFGDYEQIRDDLTTKTGAKPHELAVPYHNGFGAAWNDESADWVTRELHVNLLQDNNPAQTNHLPFLQVETRAKYDAEQKARAAQGSPLD